MTTVLTTISAIVPSLLLLWYFYKRDLNPEPRGVLIKTFMFGVLIVIPVVVVGFPLAAIDFPKKYFILEALYTAFIRAALPEELFKFIVVVWYCARHPAFDEPMDGVVYGATASLGFATLENILYVAKGGIAVAVLRAFSSVPGHACMGAIMGSYVAKGRFSGKRNHHIWIGLLAVFLIHGLYNFPLFAIRALTDKMPQREILVLLFSVFFLSVLVFTFVWTLRIVKRLRQEQKQAKASPR